MLVSVAMLLSAVPVMTAASDVRFAATERVFTASDAGSGDYTAVFRFTNAGTRTALLIHGRRPGYLKEISPDHLLERLEDLLRLF